MDDDQLIGFIEQVSGSGLLRIEENLGQGYVRLRVDEAERRQAKHDIRCVEDAVVELLRNARDAGANRIFIATTRDEDQRALTVLDDGQGIPAELQSQVFEARVTSKLETMVEDDWGVHGRGMALFSIKSNVPSARVMSSGRGLGCSLRLEIGADQLSERTDQSTFPSLRRDEAGRLEVARGPRNILRSVVEFALAHPNRPLVFLGSPAEVAATLWSQATRLLSSDTLLFCDDPTSLPVTERLAAAGDAPEFLAIATTLGLEISERTAHRILSNQIAALSDLQTQIRRRQGGERTVDIYRDSRGLKLAAEDLEAFSREMEKAFESLAARYYLSLTDLPRVLVKGDMITVRFPIEKES